MKWNGLVTTSLRCIISSSPPHCELKLHLYLGESFGDTARKDTQSNLPNALFRSKDYLLTSKSFIQRQLSSGGIKSHLWRCSDQLSSFSYHYQLILFLYQFDKNIILSTIKFHEYQLVVLIGKSKSTTYMERQIRHRPQYWKCSIFDVKKVWN